MRREAVVALLDAGKGPAAAMALETHASERSGTSEYVVCAVTNYRRDGERREPWRAPVALVVGGSEDAGEGAS